ncbi:uncharacterized protein LOC131243159 isoform X7 [Magnolia sinica]|uniref:uncharacterized protein LOC131243159 isoform X7 n=1 Tax=Magnolia sinica TaxID=86752 RepID=UPI0026589C59|nr:uncharacterized protein LOC131243159 isoform X7 [Magnolia sinica]
MARPGCRSSRVREGLLQCNHHCNRILVWSRYYSYRRDWRDRRRGCCSRNQGKWNSEAYCCIYCWSYCIARLMGHAGGSTSLMWMILLLKRLLFTRVAEEGHTFDVPGLAKRCCLSQHLRSISLSLDALLDYNDKDIEESTFEVSQKGKIGITLISHWMVAFSASKVNDDAAQRAIDVMLGW